jgi:hypothetical protein
MKIVTTIEKITPEIAMRYLETNVGHQRNVTMTHALHLRQQMEKGQWMMTGEPIVFDDNGQLMDGQHRLRALVASGMTIEFVVTRGIPSESFVAINRGKSRSNGNVMAIHGVSNSAASASCVASVLNYRRALAVETTDKDGKKKRGSLNTYIRPSSFEIVQEYDRNPERYTQAVKITYNTKKLIAPSICSTVSALAMIDAGHSFDLVYAFWSDFSSGAGLERGNPVLAFRNKVNENAGSKYKIPMATMMMMAVRSWNAYVKCESIKILRVDGSNVIPIL